MPITFFNQREFLRKYGAMMPQNATYVSATGTAGVINTAQTVITRVLPACTMQRVGDRLRVRVLLFTNAAAGIATTTKIGPAGSEVTVGHITSTAGAAAVIAESWTHYIDNTHANNIDSDGDADGRNVAGFTWNAAQNIIITQSKVATNFITIYSVLVDYFPVAP